MKLFVSMIGLSIFTFSIHSCGQTSNDMRTKLLEDIKHRAIGKEEFYNDTASLRAYAEVYGDSVLLQIDNFLKDSSKGRSLTPLREVIQKHKIKDKKSPGGWVNDFEAIFSSQEKKELSDSLDSFFKQKFKQVVVVSIDKSSVNDEKFDLFVDSIRNGWNQDFARGRIVVLGVSAGMGKARISVCDELKRKLSEEQSKKIVEDLILPEFANKSYFNGTKKGILKIIEKLK